jgi:uncharacterized delta-60 repeat protein
MFKQSRILALMLIGGACVPFYLNAGSMEESAADTTFGTNGKVLEVLSEDKGGARFDALLVQDDDKVIAAGTARDSDNYTVITLYRYLKDGSRDTSFGNDGVAVADHIHEAFNRGQEDVKDAIFQSDGKIVLATSSFSGSYEGHLSFGVARFNTDGTLDTSFGLDAGFGYGGDGVYAENSAIQSDDKILVVGTRVNNPDPHYVALTRFTADGLLDTTFGSANGTVLINTHPGTGSYSGDNGADVAVQPDGKILVVGSTAIKGCGDEPDKLFGRGLLIRLNEDGSLDTTFDGDGIVKFNASAIFDVIPWNLSETVPCTGNYIKSVKIQPDGKIVVMGTSYYYKMFVARFNPNGSLDTSFGYQGVRAAYEEYDYTSFDHLNTKFTRVYRSFSVQDMMLGKNGNIIVSGNINYNTNWDTDFLAMHFTSNGSFDARYGSIGDARVDVNFPGDTLTGGATAYALAEQKSGKVLLAGYADGYDAPSTAVLTRTVKAPNNIAPIINFLLD